MVNQRELRQRRQIWYWSN